MDIVAPFQCLRPHITATTHRQLSRITLALLVMTGRITMLGISRWAGKGGSYRTVQRWFSTVLPWALLFWVFFRQHVARLMSTSSLAMKSSSRTGQHTHGLDRFFASLYGKPVPGLPSSRSPWVSVQKRRSFPLRIEQVVRSDAEKLRKAKAAAKKQKLSAAKRRPGRPKRSKNPHKAAATLTPELVRITAMLTALLQLIATVLSVTYLVLDGHFGNHNALQMAPGRLAPHCQAAVRCGLLPLYWSLWGEVPGASMAPRWLTTTSQCNTSKRRVWRAHRDPPVPDAVAPQGVHATLACRHYRQDQRAPKPVPMSCCSAVTWPWRTNHSCTITVCGSKSSLTFEMRNSTGLRRLHECHTHGSHECSESVPVHGQCRLLSPV